MPTTIKVLGQNAPSTTANADLYTVGAGKTAVVSTISIANTTGSSATYRIFVRVAGAAASASNALVYDATLTANSTTAITIGLTLGATDVVTVQSSVASGVTFQAFGQENS